MFSYSNCTVIDNSNVVNIFPIFYCPILVSLCKLSPQFPVLSWQEWHRRGLLLL